MFKQFPKYYFSYVCYNCEKFVNWIPLTIIKPAIFINYPYLKIYYLLMTENIESSCSNIGDVKYLILYFSYKYWFKRRTFPTLSIIRDVRLGEWWVTRRKLPSLSCSRFAIIKAASYQTGSKRNEVPKPPSLSLLRCTYHSFSS